jgi:hypothetical protein
MNINWYSVVSTILWIVFGFFVSYFKTKTKLIDQAKDAINYAENEYKEAGAGGKKMQWAVKYLASLVPAPMKFIFNEKIIEEICQAAFDKIQEFATTQLDKLVGKEPE